MSTTPPALAVKRASPPLAVFLNSVIPPLFVTMLALPAVLAFSNERCAWSPMIKVGALAEWLTMPVPVIAIDVKSVGAVTKV